MTRVDPAPPAIPDYELLREIGRGSYGAVWIARGVTGLLRAVKIVWRESFPDPVPYEREFRGLREFSAVSLAEPRLLALLHVGRNDAAGFFYYVMELADDAETGQEIDPDRYVPKTLREFRHQRGRLPATETLALGVELANALAALHDHDLVHRDIKPTNIIFVANVPKLADIGLVAAAATLDESRSRVGNLGYMPPDCPGVPSADVYGLGKILYELVTGRERSDYPRLPPNLETFPDRKGLLELNEVFLKACAEDPATRYPDANALVKELRLLQAGQSVRHLRSVERHLGRALRVAAALAIATALAGVGAWMATREAKREMVLREKAEAERDEANRRRAYSGNLASAQAALAHGDLARARKLLEELAPKSGQPDLRGFEWRALWHQAQGDAREEIRRNGPEIDKLVLSPDESLLAVHDRSDSITLYDNATHREVLRVPGVWKLAGFSTDGSWLIGADKAIGTFRWSVRDGKVDSLTPANIGLPIVGLGTGEVLALAQDSPPRLRRWSFPEQREQAEVNLEMTSESPGWNPFIADASSDGATLVRAWLRYVEKKTEYRLTCIRLGRIPEVQHKNVGASRPTAVGVDTKGAWAAFDSPNRESETIVWRCGTNGWEPSAERLPRGIAKSVEFANENRHLRLVVIGRELAWLPSTTPTEMRRARGHDANINELAVSARRNRVYSGGADGSLLGWNLAGPTPPKFAAWNSNAEATGVVFSADGKKIWVPKDGDSSVLLDVATLAIVAHAPGMRYPVTLLEGQLIGVGANAGLLRVKPETGELLGQIMGSSALRIAAISSNGQAIVAIDDRHQLISAKTLEPRFPVEGLRQFVTLVLDHTGERLWMSNPTDRELVGVSWPDGRSFSRSVLSARMATFLLMPDQQHLLVALENGNLEIRDARTNVLRQEIYSGSSAPQTLAMAPDGQRLFVGGVAGDIHCFDRKTWEEIHVLTLDASAQVHRLACSPDGKTLAALTKTGALYLVRTE